MVILKLVKWYWLLFKEEWFPIGKKLNWLVMFVVLGVLTVPYEYSLLEKFTDVGLFMLFAIIMFPPLSKYVVSPMERFVIAPLLKKVYAHIGNPIELWWQEKKEQREQREKQAMQRVLVMIQNKSDVQGKRATFRLLLVTLDEDWEYIHSERSEIGSQALNNHIMRIEEYPKKFGWQLRTWSMPVIGFCGKCTGSLSSDGMCHYCGEQYKSSVVFLGWDAILSQKIIAHLTEEGHVFDQDPEVAAHTEKEEWYQRQPKIVGKVTVELE